MTRLNYDYDEGEHRSWKVSADYKGQTLREWVRRALNQVAAEQAAERAEAERRRRSRP